MKKKSYGYMRVSTVEQNDERQRIELLKWGISEHDLYSDKVSGKDFVRPQYLRLRRRLRAGDILVVKSIDRLGRNYEDIQKEWNFLVKEKGIDIVILDMPLLDTRMKKDLIGTLISDIVLQLLSYVAQTEREYIRQRQAEGIAAAKAQGKHLGRYPSPYPEEFERFYILWRKKVLTFSETARKLNVTENQLRWLVQRYRREQDSLNSQSREGSSLRVLGNALDL